MVCMEMSHNRSFKFDLFAVQLTYDSKCVALLYEPLKCAKPSFPFLRYLFFFSSKSSALQCDFDLRALTPK